MAFAIPVIIGAPIGYFTYSLVSRHVDYQVAKLCHGASSPGQQVYDYSASSTAASVLGSVVSLGLLSKTMFPSDTRHRLFFAKAPPQANIRIETLKIGMELLLRSAVIFYGSAVGGSVTGRLAVCRDNDKEKRS